MTLFNTQRRRRIFKAGIASFVPSAFVKTEANAAIKHKTPGETKIVAFMGGDYGHNNIPLEIHLRDIFSSKQDWRIIFVRASRFFTPELLSDTDLLIISRHSRPDDIGWSTEGLVDTMQKGEHLWTDENVKAIIDNVRNRGMGFMALHNTISSRNRDILNLIDIEPIMHNEIQPVWVHDLNQNHPISKGIGKFYINLDEQFAAIIKSHYTTTLFETTAIHDKRHAIGGWCLENGNGRVIGLLPGHTVFPYKTPEYQTILWRSAHWVMKRDIPPYPGEKNTLYL
ncbi:ThuA domain-containing protein [Candidatus Latescibacterota bacterium]